ncbi:MAG: tautomerase [Burkholderiales bacterium]|nr:tautomerase [Burkholderiales bacterium]
MPNILVKVPHGAFPGAAREALFDAITRVANEVEQVGDTPQQQSVTLTVIEELPPGAIRSAARDVSERVLLCIVQAYIPAGVLDGASRAAYVARLSAAFQGAMPAGDARRVLLSTLLLEMPEGQWGAGDVIWRLPDVSAAAGFKHLRSVVKP